MLSEIMKDAESLPSTFLYKIKNGLLTLADEDEACTNPKWAYWFARNVKGANIEKCQEVACKEPGWAYWFAQNVKGANIERCQEVACKDPYWAYTFARYIKGAK